MPSHTGSEKQKIIDILTPKSSDPRKRHAAKHAAMLKRAKARRSSAKEEKTIRSKVAKGAKGRKNTARKNKTGVFAVKSHAAKIADSKKATAARKAAKTDANIKGILANRTSKTRTKVTERQRERVRRLAADQSERIRTGTSSSISSSGPARFLRRA